MIHSLRSKFKITELARDWWRIINLSFTTGFLHLSTLYILGWIILYHVVGAMEDVQYQMQTPASHHSTSGDNQKCLHILPNVPCGNVARIIPVENHWFTTVRSITAKKARCHPVTAGKQLGQPNYNQRLMAEQEVKTKAIIWKKKKMWFKYLMALAWASLRHLPHSREMPVPGPYPGWALSALSLLAQLTNRSPSDQYFFPETPVLSIVLMLLYVPMTLNRRGAETQGSRRPRREAEPRSPHHKHVISLKLHFTFKVHRTLPSAPWYMYIINETKSK